MSKIITLEDLPKLRESLYAEKAEYEEDDAMAEFNYNLRCLNVAERLIKAGKTVTDIELWDLA